MSPQTRDAALPETSGLQDKALNLRESVNSSRARMSAQGERLELLRREIAELRALVEKTPPAPALAAPAAAFVPALAPVRSPRVVSVPFVKEAAPVSAAATASFRTDANWDAWKPVPYIAIFFLAAGMQIR
ncbi:MAG TPA: hypothetical protein VH309_08610, partial [Elusimicrobiota bacterium]|nr:hypothetical protein [Elusimicrobiota bacterium]